MQTEKLRAKASRKYKATTHSNHNLPVAPNLLEQDITATAPGNPVFATALLRILNESRLYINQVNNFHAARSSEWGANLDYFH